MQGNILLSIFFDLLQERKTTAPQLADKYGVSTRTVYRYVATLSKFTPLHIQRGRQGGIFLSDSYRLPVDFLSEEEYEGVITALQRAYSDRPDETYLTAKRKISAAKKELNARPLVRLEAGDILALPSGDDGLAEKLRYAQAALKEKKLLRLLVDEGERRDYAVEPHLLLLKGSEWYLYAFSYLHRGFYPFPFSKIYGISKTNERFRPRKFNAEEVILSIEG